MLLHLNQIAILFGVQREEKGNRTKETMREKNGIYRNRINSAMLFEDNIL